MNLIYYLENRHYGFLYHLIFWQLTALEQVDDEKEVYIYLPNFQKDIPTEDIAMLNTITPGLGNSENEYSKTIKEANFDLYLDVVKLLNPKYKILYSYKDFPTDYKLIPLRISNTSNNGDFTNCITKQQILFIKKILVSSAIEDTHKRLLYISRKNSENTTVNHIKTRQVINDEDFKTSLNLLGFEYIQLEDYSVKDKINLFNSAEVIISPNSGALSFLIFSRPSCKVVELLPPLATKREHDGHTQFKEICVALNLEFHRFQDVEDFDSGGNMTINPEKFINYLKNNNII